MMEEKPSHKFLRENKCPKCFEPFKEGLTAKGYFLRHKCGYMILTSQYLDIIVKDKEVDDDGGKN